MLPTLREIAYQVAIMHELHPKETISEIATRLMYSPLFIINALDEGEKMELFSRVKGEDTLIANAPVDYQSMLGLDFGQENVRLQNEILRVIASANADKNDVEEGTLMNWCRGIKPADIEIALHVLKQVEFIVSYELTDPKDKKSKYTFYSLRINEGNMWGTKQFKTAKKEKK
jgi:hypothetical protein